MLSFCAQKCHSSPLRASITTIPSPFLKVMSLFEEEDVATLLNISAVASSAWVFQRVQLLGTLLSDKKLNRIKKHLAQFDKHNREQLLCRWCSRRRPSLPANHVKLASYVSNQHFCDINHIKFRLHVYELTFSSGGGGGDVGDRQEITVHFHFSYQHGEFFRWHQTVFQPLLWQRKRIICHGMSGIFQLLLWWRTRVF